VIAIVDIQADALSATYLLSTSPSHSLGLSNKMSDEGNPQAAVVPAPVESVPAHPDAVAEPEIKDAAIANGTDTNAGVETSEPKEVATDAPVEGMTAILL
jgi:hypothetical protein